MVMDVKRFLFRTGMIYNPVILWDLALMALDVRRFLFRNST